MKDQTRLRELILEQLTGRNAHVDFDRSIQSLNIKEIGIRPEKLPHSIWELVEHIRIAQHDIVAFSRNPEYQSPSWPDEYWPSSQEPAGRKEWEQTVDAVHKDHQVMVELIKDPGNDLLKPLEHGDGQTLFREAMLIVDHNAYHIGQIVQVRKYLGNW